MLCYRVDIPTQHRVGEHPADQEETSSLGMWFMIRHGISWSAGNAGDLGQEDPLEKETATHSSILVWKIPWTEKSGRLESMGSQKGRAPLSN